MSPYRWLAAFPLAAAISSPALAGPLTFAEALERAQVSAPGLQAASLTADAARASARSAGGLPDPKLGLSLENFPISGPHSGRFGADEMTMGRIGLQQDVPNAERRRAARAEAGAAVAQAEALQTAEARKVKLGAALAWIDLAYAERRLAAVDQVLQTLAPIWEAQPAAVASGRARPAQTITAVEKRAALEDQRSELAAAAARARAELTRWTGEPGPSTAGSAPSFEIDPVALRTGLDDVPALRVGRAAVSRADAGVAAARAAKRPDLGFEVLAQEMPLQRTRLLLVGAPDEDGHAIVREEIASSGAMRPTLNLGENGMPDLGQLRGIGGARRASAEGCFEDGASYTFNEIGQRHGC